MAKVAPRGLSLLLVLALASCAPPGIPSDALRHYSIKDGAFWTWRRPANAGCSSWLANERWASVQVLIDTPCETVDELGFSKGKGLSFFSVEDHLVFKGFWPWTPEVYAKLIVYDHRGMFVDALPCPNALTNDEIARMRVTAIAGIADASTDAEKRVISRIVERLDRVEGKALSSGQEGCSDWQDGDDARQQADPWKAK